MINKLFMTALFFLLISLMWIWVGKGKDVKKEAKIIQTIDNVFMYVFVFSFLGFVVFGVLNIWV